MRKILYVLIGSVCIFSSLMAQDNMMINTSTDRAAQYYLGSQDELLIPVNIWGFVRKPGQYMIPNNTDLISLLSFAGGPTEYAKISNIRIIRNNPLAKSEVMKVNVKKFLETGQYNNIIPALKPGDTIIVKGTTFHWINRFFSFISSLTFLVQIYYLITLAEQYKN